LISVCDYSEIISRPRVLGFPRTFGVEMEAAQARLITIVPPPGYLKPL